jgi:putative endonuclease
MTAAGTERRRQARRAGKRGETAAAWLLRLKGYRILARDLRIGPGEVDIVALRGRTLAFVEVKARPDADLAKLAIGPAQRRRIAGAASAFLARHPRLAGHTVRFDALLVAPRRIPIHIVNAWTADE